METAMIYCGESPHPAHRGLAEAVDADFLGLDRFSFRFDSLRHSILEEIMNGAGLPSFDIYIAEGTRALYGSIANQIGNDATLIYLAGDQALYKLLDSSYEHESTLNRLIAKFGMKPLSYAFNRYIDGVIAVSDFSRDYTREILNDKPSHVVNPYIQPELFDQLGNVHPNLENKTAITVGSFAKYKGQDLLVEAWESVRQKHPTAKLHLVGNGYPSSFEDIPGVRVRGYVENIVTELGSGSLYIQPSRVDNFPVSVLEALRAGLPALVTETTGNRAVAKEIDEKLVVEPTPESIASGINWYFDQSISSRKHFSDAAWMYGSEFDSNTQKQEFREKFHRLLSELDSDRFEGSRM